MVPAAYQKGGHSVRLLAATKPATSHKAAAVTYKVRSGDSLSAIAGHFYHNTNAWPVIYYGNRGRIRWANDIRVGQELSIPAKPAHIPRAPSQLGPSTYTPRHASTAPVAAEVQTTTTAATTYSGAYPGGAFGACVVARESGGNPQIWNASGHYGLYQFSESTWIAYGGSPAEFGDATVAEQNAVFATALAEGGEDNWAPYDGC
jgi:LysM repeat protein